MPVREVSGVNPTRDGGNKPGEGAEPFRVSELVHDIGGAADVEDAANRTIKHALDLTGARWAAILEPRSPDMLGVLATTRLRAHTRDAAARRTQLPTAGMAGAATCGRSDIAVSCGLRSIRTGSSATLPAT
jgi:hypothetical protein